MVQQMNPAQGMTPMAVANDEGEARWWFGSLAVIKTSAPQTGGPLSIIENT
jgi:hypothetical protein